ncbi:TonB-dependent receptor [Novosphingobium resinovorum]|uniref:TonB-dependent receptor n=1 Tax=Novosphingobium resinovorum TaxID=158500 RepID=UPI002ED29E5B|nr:TonB-dependent receptor [Novosphingobium resinovorum]
MIRTILACSTCIASLGIAPLALAQSAQAEDNTVQGIQDIVVTAERREASVQRSAVAISVISADDLERGGVSNASALLDSVPGLDITRSNINANISLRGLGGGGSTQYADPVVGLNVGGVPLSRTFSAASAMYDLARVEVLKGPQGTLYGRNATVGAVNLIPNKPTFTLSGKAGVEVGNYDAFRSNAMINVPLGDTVAVRAAGQTNFHDGYLSNGYDDADNKAGRLSVLFEPGSDFSALVWLDYYRDRSHGPGTVLRYQTAGQEWAVPGNPWYSFAPAGCGTPALCPTWGDSAGQTFNDAFKSQSVVGDDGFVHLTQRILAGELTWHTGIGTLTVVPANVTTAADTRTYSGGLTYTLRNRTYQNSVEARLASDGNGPFKWLVGGIYFYEHINSNQQTFEPNGFQIITSPNLTDESVGVFAQATYSVLDRLRLTGGVRYTSETKKQDGFSLLTGAFTTATCPSPGVVVSGATTAYGHYYPNGYCQVPNEGRLHFTNVSWKAGLEFDAAERSLLYANVSTGFKAGGFAPALPPNTYKPEKLTAFQIGSKNRFLDNRLQFNVEAFYWKYKNQQVNVLQTLHPAGQSAYPVNVDGDLKGAEANIVAQPLNNTTLTFDVLYARGKYDIYPTAVSSTGTLGGLTDFPRINLPRWSGTVKAQQVIPVGASEFVLAGDMHFESKANLRPVAAENLRPGDIRDAFATFNASLTWNAPGDRYSVSAFVNNITNEAIIGTGTGSGNVGPGTFYRPSTNPADARMVTLQPPRTYGVRVSASF